MMIEKDYLMKYRYNVVIARPKQLFTKVYAKVKKKGKEDITYEGKIKADGTFKVVFDEKPAEFDPRKYLGPARTNMEKMYKHKIINVLGSDNKLA